MLSLAEAEFFRVRWTDEILTETEAALAKIHTERNSENPEGRAKRAIDAMKRAFPEASVADYQNLMTACGTLPDDGDRHVVAAAMRTQAQAIVTENLKDFPSAILEEMGLEARCADDFIADTIALDEGRAVAAIRQMRERLAKPTMDAEALLRSLEAHGLTETATILYPHSASL